MIQKNKIKEGDILIMNELREKDNPGTFLTKGKKIKVISTDTGNNCSYFIGRLEDNDCKDDRDFEIKYTEVDYLCSTIEDFNRIISSNKDLIKEIEIESISLQDKIDWMKKSKIKHFNEKKYKIFKVITSLEDSKLTKDQKVDIIHDLFK